MLRKKKSLIDQAVDSASDAIEAARPLIESAVAQARDLSKDAAVQAKDLAIDTRVKAAPLIADTKVLAAEIAEATREVAIPKAKTAAAAGVAGAASLAASGKDLATAKVAAVKAEPEPEQKKRGSKLRAVLIFGTLAAVAGFIYNKLRSSAQADNWQSSYTPPSPAGSTTSATTGGTGAAAGGAHLAAGVGPDEPIAGDDPMARLAAEQGLGGVDPGGASPDEAIADAVDQPHAVTTPDNPADVVEVDESAAKNT